MSEPIVSGVKCLLSKRLNELDTLSIGWFGGEPLLARTIIRDISEHVLRNKPAHLKYSANVTTNGYLLDQNYFDELISLGVSRFQISLDGTAQAHDLTRLRADGEGTFERIWANLLMARDSDHDFVITIRVHFSPSNIEAIESLVKKIDLEFADDDRFRIFPKAIGHYGGPNDATFQTYSRESRLKVLRKLQSLSKKLQLSQNSEPNTPYICYAAKPSSLVVRSNGRLAKCTVALESNSNDVGRLLPNGKLEFNNDRLERWFAGFHTLTSTDLGCPWHRISREEAK